MNNYILFDDKVWKTLLPLTYTRPVCEIRIGIMTIREKWEKLLQTTTSTLTKEYLSIKYPINITDTMLLINGSICPNNELIEAINNLKLGDKLINKDSNDVIAMYKTKADLLSDNDNMNTVYYKGKYNKITSLASIFLLNEKEIVSDYTIITKNRHSMPISSTNRFIGEDIFIEQGAKVEFSILNASDGPIYIGKDCVIMENCVIKGPFAMNEHSIIKTGAKIYGETTIGPYCKVGGEVENVVFLGYSNKAHDGFFGNSIIGQWCNIGADSNTSNLKNTYDEVKLWSIENEKFERTGTIFCGTVMADHSKCGINTMFNTGTVIGVCCNIFGGGFQRNYIPSFSWGGTSGLTEYDFDKAIQVAATVEKRRNIEFNEIEKDILYYIYKQKLNNNIE